MAEQWRLKIVGFERRLKLNLMMDLVLGIRNIRLGLGGHILRKNYMNKSAIVGLIKS